MRTLLRLSLLCAAMVIMVPAQHANAQIDVFLDFTTDNHNGGGGGSNGTADWIDELNDLTTALGISNFNASERSTLESNIIADLNTIYGDYLVNFSTSTTGGSEERIYFGVQSGALGFAPLDIGNLFNNDLGPANVAPASFGFIVETGESRAQQIAELSAAIAGTAAHELGHSLGLHHHMAYSDPGITPATYANTGGLQNQYVMATGSTGLGEPGREVVRSFSPFSKVMLDITGGSATFFGGQDNGALVSAPVFADSSERGANDAGGTSGTAQATTFSKGESSGMDIIYVQADLENASDVDMFSFTVNGPGTFSAHVFSDSLLFGAAGEFDPVLELIDIDGSTVLKLTDDTDYSGNAFDSGGFGSVDSFINNIELDESGTYFLRVSAFTGGEAGSEYFLVGAFASAIPEPNTAMFCGLLALGTLLCRQRRRRI